MVVERAPHLRDDGYMIDFFGSGFDVAERLGLLPARESIHYPVDRLMFVNECGAEQGASMALTAAYTLAEELDAHGAVRQALARYEERLKPAIERQQEAGRRIAKWFVPDDTHHRIVRDLATRMSTWPGIAGVVRRRMAAESVLGGVSCP